MGTGISHPSSLILGDPCFPFPTPLVSSVLTLGEIKQGQ